MRINPCFFVVLLHARASVSLSNDDKGWMDGHEKEMDGRYITRSKTTTNTHLLLSPLSLSPCQVYIIRTLFPFSRGMACQSQINMLAAKYYF